MHLRQLLATGALARNFYRSYVSRVSVNLKAINAISIKPMSFFEKSDEKVRLTVLDSMKKTVEISSLSTANVQSTSDDFSIDCQDAKDHSIVLEIPLEKSPEIEIEVKVGSGSVDIGNMQLKSIKIDVECGFVELNNLKGDLIKVESTEGNIATKKLLLGKNIQLEAKRGDISIEKTQGDFLEAKGSSITVDSCYSTKNKFKSTGSTVLKNLHGRSKIISSGQNFKLSGFAGSLDAKLDNEEIEIQLSELYGENSIVSTKQGAVLKLGLSEGIIGDTVVQIKSDCNIENLVPELIICQRNKDSFEIKKENSESKNSLKVKVENGKNLELSKMSWIDSLKLREAA